MVRQESPEKYGKHPCKLCRRYRNEKKDTICDKCESQPLIEVKI